LERAERNVAWRVHREASEIGMTEFLGRGFGSLDGFFDVTQHPRVGHLVAGFLVALVSDCC
jgi:hypothetical protein